MDDRELSRDLVTIAPRALAMITARERLGHQYELGVDSVEIPSGARARVETDRAVSVNRRSAITPSTTRRTFVSSYDVHCGILGTLC